MTLARVVVTGGGGWLGRSLVPALTRGLPAGPEAIRAPMATEVRALALPDEVAGLRAAAPEAELVVGDLRELTTCQRLVAGAEGGVLIHAAGVIHPRRVRTFYEVNVEGSRRLLEAAAEAGVRRAVVISSNSPFGFNLHDDHLFTEDSPYAPYRHYGRSKWQLERFAGELQRAGQLEVVVVRAPWFYGPGQPPRQKLFFRMIRDGKAPLVRGGACRRSMAYVDNLTQGVLLCATHPAAGGRTYWIADRRPYPMAEVLDTIERLLEEEFGQRCAHRRLRLPRWLCSVAGAADALIQGVGAYHQKLHVLSEMGDSIACSTTRAERELGYAPAIELEEGMRRSLREVFERDGGLD